MDFTVHPPGLEEPARTSQSALRNALPTPNSSVPALFSSNGVASFASPQYQLPFSPLASPSSPTYFNSFTPSLGFGDAPSLFGFPGSFINPAQQAANLTSECPVSQLSSFLPPVRPPARHIQFQAPAAGQPDPLSTPQANQISRLQPEPRGSTNFTPNSISQQPELNSDDAWYLGQLVTQNYSSPSVRISSPAERAVQAPSSPSPTQPRSHEGLPILPGASNVANAPSGRVLPSAATTRPSDLPNDSTPSWNFDLASGPVNNPASNRPRPAWDDDVEFFDQFLSDDFSVVNFDFDSLTPSLPVPLPPTDTMPIETRSRKRSAGSEGAESSGRTPPKRVRTTAPTTSAAATTTASSRGRATGGVKKEVERVGSNLKGEEDRKLQTIPNFGSDAYEHEIIDLVDDEVPKEFGAPEAVNKTKLSDLTCTICMDHIHALTITHCGHLFCSKCLHQALTISNSRKTCPICRQKIDSLPPNGKYGPRHKGYFALELKAITKKKLGKRPAA